MRIWWITLILTFALCVLARMYSKEFYVKDECVNYKPNKFFSFLALSILALVSGLRLNIGDTQTYMRHFNQASTDFDETLSLFFSNNGSDKGFTLVQGFIKAYITDDAQIYLLILATITLTLIFIVFYKNCGMLELGVFLFITAGNYLVSMNAVRQYLASSILFFSFPLIYKRKWYLYFMIVILVSTIHSSALFLIPLYFLVNTTAWGKVSKCILIGGILIYVSYPITGRIIAALLESTQYSAYGDGLVSGAAGSSNFIRTLVYSVPVILSYFERKTISENEKYFNIFVNFSIINLIFMLLSNAASWIFARYCIYFSLYMIVLLCWCIKYIKNKKEKRLVYYSCVILFSLYYFYEMHISLRQIYISNIISF